MNLKKHWLLYTIIAVVVYVVFLHPRVKANLPQTNAGE